MHFCTVRVQLNDSRFLSISQETRNVSKIIKDSYNLRDRRPIVKVVIINISVARHFELSSSSSSCEIYSKNIVPFLDHSIDTITGEYKDKW